MATINMHNGHHHFSLATAQARSNAARNHAVSRLIPQNYSRHDRYTWDEEPQAARLVIVPDSTASSSSSASPEATSLRSTSVHSESQKRPVLFTFVEQKPNEAPGRGQLKVIRQAAMKNYLRREGGDRRAKRRANATSSQSGSSSTNSPPDHRTRPPGIPFVFEVVPVPNNDPASHQYPHLVPLDSQNIVYRYFDTSEAGPRYTMDTMPELQHTPALAQGERNQFHEWPVTPGVFGDGEVERLKNSCSKLFSCVGISKPWLVEMIRSRNAFCSTICISAAHEDIMESEHQDVSSIAIKHARRRRLEVRDKLILLMLDSISQGGTSDGNLIAIVHILFSELMSGNKDNLIIHVSALILAVDHRGGLEMLGLGGRLASVIVVMITLAACLTESLPADTFLAKAFTTATEPPPTLVDNHPDAPIYTSRSYDESNVGTESARRLLERTREATNMFYILHGVTSATSASPHQAKERLRQCYAAILGNQESEPLTPAARRTECIQLACQIFVHALVKQLPLSEAAPHLDTIRAQTAQNGIEQRQSIIVEFKDALKASAFDDCWKTSSNVLFWCGLVVLTAADGMLPGIDTDDIRWGEFKRARDFIAAVTIRAATKQIFGRTVTLLGVLKRFLRIQQLLRGEGNRIAYANSHYGPARPMPVYQVTE